MVFIEALRMHTGSWRKQVSLCIWIKKPRHTNFLLNGAFFIQSNKKSSDKCHLHVYEQKWQK